MISRDDVVWGYDGGDPGRERVGMDRTRAAAVSRHDAAERLTYAALTHDRAGLHEAVEMLRKADDIGAGQPAQEVRAAVVDADPVTAASVGWLTFDRLGAIVSQEPDRYLSADESAAYARFGDPVLRVLVRSRVDGVPFEQALVQFSNRRSDYALAARGVLRNPKLLQKLLREQGLLGPNDR